MALLGPLLSLKGQSDWERCARTRGKQTSLPSSRRSSFRKEDPRNYRPWEGDGPITPGNHFQTKKDKKVTGSSQHGLTKGSFANP